MNRKAPSLTANAGLHKLANLAISLLAGAWFTTAQGALSLIHI